MEFIKRISSAAAAITAAALLGSCGYMTNTDKSIIVTDKPQVTKITFFGNKYKETNVKVIDDIIKGFMKKNPGIEVKYEGLKGGEYYEVLRKRMETGNGDDVFVVDSDTMRILENNHQLADLSGASVIKKYSDLVKNQITNSDGTVYMLPTTVSMFGLYCNMNLLKEHNKAVPQNMSEFEDICEYFRQQGMTPLVANNDDSLKVIAYGRGFYDYYKNGEAEDIINKVNSGEEKLSTYLRPGFEKAEEFIKKGYVNSEEALNSYRASDDLKLFERGNSPFMICGAWAEPRLADEAPNLNFSVYPLPVLDDGSVVVINPGVRLAVNENSKHKEEAIKFVEYFTEEENINKFSDEQCSLNPIKNSRLPAVKHIQPLVEAYKDKQVVIGSDTRFNAPIWDYGMEISRGLLMGKPLDELMNWLDEQK